MRWPPESPCMNGARHTATHHVVTLGWLRALLRVVEQQHLERSWWRAIAPRKSPAQLRDVVVDGSEQPIRRNGEVGHAKCRHPKPASSLLEDSHHEFEQPMF